MVGLLAFLSNTLRIAFTVCKQVIKDKTVRICVIHLLGALVFVSLPSIKVPTQSTNLRVEKRGYLKNLKNINGVCDGQRYSFKNSTD
jgi:hypothetical protein